MIVTMSRQDLQGVVDYAKNKIIERLVTKYDVQTAANQAANRVIDDLQDVRKANLPYIKQNMAITDQVWQRTQAIENRLSVIEQNLRDINAMMGRVMGAQVKTANTLQRY